jgi:alpha-ketoglutarate-dependent 2,4-dichlorophenoxyacetate dioxygenase
MALNVQPILPDFGAEVSGADLTQPLDEGTQQEIRAIQARWGVTVWRDTGLDDLGHVAFSRIFGDLYRMPGFKSGSRFGAPEIFDASNLDREGNINQDENLRTHKRGDRLWHPDTSFLPQRSGWSLLLCHETPPAGGATWFADARGAYDGLTQAMKDKIENLEAEHSHAWSRRRGGMDLSETDVDALPGVRHRLVHVHPGSGRKTIYIGSHARDILGMDRVEGRALIDELIAWATQPQYIFSVSYAPGDMTIWDNLCTFHRGGEFDDINHRRDMRRTTVHTPAGMPLGTVREPIVAAA